MENEKYISDLSPEVLTYNLLYHLKEKHGIDDEAVSDTVRTIINNFVKKENN